MDQPALWALSPRWLLGGSLALAAFVGLQFAPAPDACSNPAVDPRLALEGDPAVPPGALRVVARACYNCHSQTTRWPWYARLAPASWIVAGDVSNAREALNFSRWGALSPPMRAGLLAAACQDVSTGRMPKLSYRYFHPEARLSAADREQICAWSRSALRNLVPAKSAGVPVE
jgi:hypothetical protein